MGKVADLLDLSFAHMNIHSFVHSVTDCYISVNRMQLLATIETAYYYCYYNILASRLAYCLLPPGDKLLLLLDQQKQQ